jgi:transposase-like protein
MDMTMSSLRPSRVEVVTSSQQRRRWTPEQKLEIVKQTMNQGVLCPDSQTVMSQLKAWFDDYNSYHPHSALRYLPP